MKAACLAAVIAAAIALPAAAQSPFSAFKGKLKPGLYEYDVEMDMGNVPGMPPGMGKQRHKMQNCITEKDIEQGGFESGKKQDCQVSDFRMSGNTANYTMTCKGEGQMVAKNTITFVGDGFKTDMVMNMNHGGQQMQMTHRGQSRYIGPCK